jgi:DNA modification methylase
MRELYSTFAMPGSRLLIPFLGSGVGLLAATELGISALGFEKSKEYKDSFLVRAHNLLQKK